MSLRVGSNATDLSVFNGTNTTYFEGFFFQARVAGSSAPIGAWTVLDSANQALVACGGVASSALGHSNPNWKNATTARWTAPSSLAVANVFFLYVITEELTYLSLSEDLIKPSSLFTYFT